MNKFFLLLKAHKIEITLFFIVLLFSTWLMFSTFFYKNGNMLIASKAWSDFGSHIPLIRSFSLGNNFPPEYPLFSGEPIKYHFFFYALVGIFERIGIQIDYALNLPSILGFTFLIMMIYTFAKYLFKSTAVGLLSVLFFLLNGSLSFIKFFSIQPISNNTLKEILSNQTFPSFGPYDHTSIVSAFWNLNIYTNQRHLGISYGLSMLIVYLFLTLKYENRKKAILKSILIGITLGFSFLLNMAVFLMTCLILLCLILFLEKRRIYIFSSLIISAMITMPFYLYISSSPSTFSITTHLGYLVEKFGAVNFLSYWFQNLGLHSILMVLGLIISSKLNKKIFISLFSLFLIGNIIQFSPEISANHKFFNYFMIVGVMFSSYALVYLWNKRKYFKPLVILLIFFLTLSGIIDFFPILNDSKIALADKNDKDVQWIINNTPKNAVFLNTDYFMDKANIAGRKIFLGWPYFAWSQGYDTLKRDQIRKDLLSSDNLSYFCTKTNENNLEYLEINSGNQYDFKINIEFLNSSFKKLYENPQTHYEIYSIKKSCL